MPDPKKVFVIHGRNDDDARRAMGAFLRSIGLEPIEWSQALETAGGGSPFIGDIVDKAFDSAQAILALLTGDDLARIGTRYGVEALTPQPRSNVIFEAGMAFGRVPNRTVLVALGRVRPLRTYPAAT